MRRKLFTSSVLALLCGVGCDRGCDSAAEQPAPAAVSTPAPRPVAVGPITHGIDPNASAGMKPARVITVDAAAIGSVLPQIMPVPLGHDMFRLADGRCQLITPVVCPADAHCEAPTARFVPCP